MWRSRCAKSASARRIGVPRRGAASSTSTSAPCTSSRSASTRRRKGGAAARVGASLRATRAVAARRDGAVARSRTRARAARVVERGERELAARVALIRARFVDAEQRAYVSRSLAACPLTAQRGGAAARGPAGSRGADGACAALKRGGCRPCGAVVAGVASRAPPACRVRAARARARDDDIRRAQSRPEGAAAPAVDVLASASCTRPDRRTDAEGALARQPPPRNARSSSAIGRARQLGVGERAPRRVRVFRNHGVSRLPTRARPSAAIARALRANLPMGGSRRRARSRARRGRERARPRAPRLASPVTQSFVRPRLDAAPLRGVRHGGRRSAGSVRAAATPRRPAAPAAAPARRRRPQRRTRGRRRRRAAGGRAPQRARGLGGGTRAAARVEQPRVARGGSIAAARDACAAVAGCVTARRVAKTFMDELAAELEESDTSRAPAAFRARAWRCPLGPRRSRRAPASSGSGAFATRDLHDCGSGGAR